MRTTIGIQGAREHNLKNISLEIPRDQLIVVTGVSGSGKSSLAFDTIYAEDYDFLFAEVRKKGYRRVVIDGAVTDISEEIELDESVDHEMEVIADRFVIKPAVEKQLKVAVENALMVGERFLGVRFPDG